MESKPSTSPAIPKIRTFADDLKRLNPTAAVTTTEPTPKPSKPAAIPKAKAARALPNVVRDPAPKPIPKPSIPAAEPKATTPPAFHTLQKTTIGKAPKAIPKKPARDTIEITGSTDDYDSTTIIKDTVRRRTNFFSAIGESLGNAGRDFKRFWKKANQPLYVIPEAERRKGVIQQATSQTGKTFTADYDRLKERLRQRAEQSDLVPEQDITWSPLTEPGFDLLPGDTAWSNPISNVRLEPKRIHTVTATPTATPVVSTSTPPPTTPAEPSKPKPKLILPKKIAAATPAIPPPVVIEPKPVATATPVVPAAPVSRPAEAIPPAPQMKPAVPTAPIPPMTPPPPAPVTPPPTAVLAPTPEPVSDVMAAVPSEMEEPTTPLEADFTALTAKPAPEPTRPPVREASPELINRVTTNTLTIAIAGGLVSIVLIVVVVTRVVGVLWSTPSETVVTTISPTIALTTLPLSAVPYTITTPEPLLTTLISAAATNQALHELYVTQPEGGNWTPSQLLAAQNLSINSAFGASLSEVRWVAEGGIIIGLVFRYTNPTQITGSLLGWEAAMNTELGRLLPVQDRETTGFIDQRLQQTDVRQARNGVTYGRVSDTHGIIAVSGEAFTTIANTLVQ